jgi:hypothetical protein
MSTSSGGAVGGEATGVTVSVTTLLAFGASDLSQFAGGGLVGSASLVLLLESIDGLSLCVCVGAQSLTAKIGPLLLRRREVDASCCGTSEAGNFTTEARDSAVS